METRTPKYEVILSDPEAACEIRKADDGHLHVVCSKCGEWCMLTLSQQRVSYLGTGGSRSQALFRIQCPKCGNLPKKLAI